MTTRTVAAPSLVGSSRRFDPESEAQFRRQLEQWMQDVATAMRANQLPVALQSPTFAIDSTGLRTVTTAHELRAAPLLSAVQATVIEESDVDDWAYNLLKVESVDATNVVCKLNVSTASATGSSTARLGLLVMP